MRVFIAINLPEEIKKKIVKVQEALMKKGLFEGKLTEKENLHLTLKFLGEISEERAEEAGRRLKEIKFPEFNAKLGKIGVFSESFIRIIWIKLDNCEELQKEIDMKLEGLFKKEERFMSHLTIARVKNVKDKAILLGALKEMEISGEFCASEFSLEKSELNKKGPEYKIIEKYRLER